MSVTLSELMIPTQKLDLTGAFIGIPGNNAPKESPYLLELRPNKNGMPTAILDAAKLPQSFGLPPDSMGINILYLRLLPNEDYGVVLIPPTKSLLKNPEIIYTAVRSAGVSISTGGEDLGYHYRSEIPPSKFTAEYGEISEDRDNLNMIIDCELDRLHDENGATIFDLRICRGIQRVLTRNGMVLVEADPQHAMPGNFFGLGSHQVATVNGYSELGLSTFELPGKHHLHGKDSIPQSMTKSGWVDSYRSDDGGIEVLYQYREGKVTGLAAQGHPERYYEGHPQGEIFLAHLHAAINEHNQQNNNRQNGDFRKTKITS